MFDKFKNERWSPYLVGTGIGMLSWLTFMFMDKALGVSTTFVRMIGSLIATVSPEHISSTPYYAKYLVGKPGFEWQAALVVMIFVGALVASKLSGSRRSESMPEIWKERFGPSKAKRYLAAFLGGFLVLFGARLAGGCTSGHAISGGMQLALSGWVFMMAMFAFAIAAATILYKNRN